MIQSTSSNNGATQNPDLVIRVNSTVRHNTPCATTTCDNAELKSLLEQSINKLAPKDYEAAEWKSDQEVEFNKLNNMALHNFLLEAEKRGKQVTFTKSLTVQISE